MNDKGQAHSAFWRMFMTFWRTTRPRGIQPDSGEESWRRWQRL